jgi:2-amino-4-hydroxy-6-hydroxymethyldihydropteridine diphosphokinase
LQAATDVDSVRASSWQLTLPVGGFASQREFLNGAALVETSLSATDLLALLQQIESRHGRARGERWGNRTLDLDLLLYGDAIVDTPALVVPHPRMSFRRFVLEPAAEIAGEMVHPAILWTIERLVEHLDTGSDCVAIVSPDDSARVELAATLGARYGLIARDSPGQSEAMWPRASTTWLTVANGHLSSEHPKLTILLDDSATSEAGRGPTLRIGRVSSSDAEREAFAAIEAVWPHLAAR